MQEASFAARPTIRPPYPLRRDSPAYQGKIGDLIKVIAPHTEACPEAILTGLLTGIGNILGNNIKINAGRLQKPNLYSVIIGRSSQSRKGTAISIAEKLLAYIDPDWHENCVDSGLYSGEGLLLSMRDDRFDNEGNLLEKGVDDKRRLYIEEEFSDVLTLFKGKTSILSGIIRKGFDSIPLRQNVKNYPLKVREPHLSIMGAITLGELKATLSARDLSSGMVNRIAWIHAYRSKPDKPRAKEPIPNEMGVLSIFNVHNSDSENHIYIPLDKYLDPIKNAIESELKRPRVIEFNAEAQEYWDTVIVPKYGKDLPETPLTQATDRANAIIPRVALIYAVVAQSEKIRLVDLKSGEAFWKYAEQTAVTIWGQTLGNRTADDILNLIYSTSYAVSLTEISNFFNRNKSREDITEALNLLIAFELVMESKKSTNGREATLYEPFLKEDEAEHPEENPISSISSNSYSSDGEHISKLL